MHVEERPFMTVSGEVQIDREKEHMSNQDVKNSFIPRRRDGIGSLLDEFNNQENIPFIIVQHIIAFHLACPYYIYITQTEE